MKSSKKTTARLCKRNLKIKRNNLAASTSFNLCKINTRNTAKGLIRNKLFLLQESGSIYIIAKNILIQSNCCVLILDCLCKLQML